MLKSLTLLEARNNAILSLPLSLGKLGNLSKLDLSNNMLTDLPKSVGGLKNLTVLEVRGNNFEDGLSHRKSLPSLLKYIQEK